MFETFAVLSTLTCIVIFVVLVQIDRTSRREDAEQHAPPARPGNDDPAA